MERALKEMGLELPAAPAAVGAYTTWSRSGSLIFTSGQLPWWDGKLQYVGRVGLDLTAEEGYAAARICALNAIAQLREAVGDLDRIVQIVRVDASVNCSETFSEHAAVLNGASDLLNAAFGPRGRHTRTLQGISYMPLRAAVQVSVIAECSMRQSTAKPRVGPFLHFTLPTTDLNRAVRFLEEALGWERINRPANIAVPAAWLQIAPGQEVHVLEIAGFEPTPLDREYGRHIAFECASGDLQAIRERVLRAGGQIIEPERPTQFRRFFVREPGGLVIEIVDAARQPEG